MNEVYSRYRLAMRRQQPVCGGAGPRLLKKDKLPLKRAFQLARTLNLAQRNAIEIAGKNRPSTPDDSTRLRRRSVRDAGRRDITSLSSGLLSNSDGDDLILASVTLNQGSPHPIAHSMMEIEEVSDQTWLSFLGPSCCRNTRGAITLTRWWKRSSSCTQIQYSNRHSPCPGPGVGRRHPPTTCTHIVPYRDLVQTSDTRPPRHPHHMPGSLTQPSQPPRSPPQTTKPHPYGDSFAPPTPPQDIWSTTADQYNTDGAAQVTEAEKPT
ncbi:uncharacterized protein [Narcine bancroftii]|uniref:uncharacterized protein n=1 Tax=Narcine bancroftii TaxID=1343680 RepID=UPI0038310122